MKHATESTGRIKRARIYESTVHCPKCLDTRIRYFRRVGQDTGVLPCVHCARGLDKHGIDGPCLWASGTRPCRLCGAHAGGLIPDNWQPVEPIGGVSPGEISALEREDVKND